MQTTSSSKSVACALYRSLLRACNNGRHPHVFGEYVHITNAESIPTSAKHTRNILRSIFQSDENENNNLHDLFPVIRRCNELSSILHPKIENLPSSIPIFDFSSSTALFGEEVQFHFFEPRYVQLCKDAISDIGDGIFIIRANMEKEKTEEEDKEQISVLLKIVEHKQAEFDEGPRYMVRCIGGPRVRILKQETMKISENVPSLERATEIEIDADDFGNCDVLKQECLDLLIKTCGIKSVLSTGAPPINSEQFSFFALPFVLAHNDVPGRLKWLKCKSTEQRLQHVIDVLEAYAASKEKENSS